MKICPSYQLSVLKEESFREEMAAISEQLDKCRVEGTFSGVDGQPLYYEYFLAEGSRGAVVVVHGLSEFTGKYHEFAWYLLNQGYDVFLYDQRCHGRSCRLTDRLDLIHVDRFTDYREDLHRFVCDVVRKVTGGPLYLYAHSMGGAVAAQYLCKYPDTFRKAVLSAPMVEPLTGGVPPLVARWGLSACLLLGKGKQKFWGADEFDPDYPFERSQDKSAARFYRNMEVRLANSCYCTTPQTVRWVQQSLMQRFPLTKKRCLKKIRTPILMICAQQDKVVCEKAQAEMAGKCQACQRVVQPDTTHAMLGGTAETIEAHVRLVLDHFG